MFPHWRHVYSLLKAVLVLVNLHPNEDRNLLTLAEELHFTHIPICPYVYGGLGLRQTCWGKQIKPKIMCVYMYVNDYTANVATFRCYIPHQNLLEVLLSLQLLQWASPVIIHSSGQAVSSSKAKDSKKQRFLLSPLPSLLKDWWGEWLYYRMWLLMWREKKIPVQYPVSNTKAENNFTVLSPLL